MRRLIAFAALAFFAGASLFSGPARAQVFIVAACGTVPASQATLTAGNPGMMFIDTNGRLCGATTATPGTVTHASTAALANSLAVKASPGTLFGFNCSAVTGGAAGYCVAYNATAAPGAGALTGALVLDVCYFDTTARGCSLYRNGPIAYSAGIVILVTSATTPFTYTTGTDTAYVSADYQ